MGCFGRCGGRVAPESGNTGEKQPWDVSFFDIVFTFGSIVAYLFDVGGNMYVAHTFYINGDWWWFAYTVTVIVVANVIINMFSLSLYIADYRYEKEHNENTTSPLRWAVICVCLVLHITPLLR